jgi:hypothetical protein
MESNDKRKQQLIYMRPSLKRRIDALRMVTQESRSQWIERAVLPQVLHEERNVLREFGALVDQATASFNKKETGK